MGAVSTCAPHKKLRNGSGNSFLPRYGTLRSLRGERRAQSSQAQPPLYPACGLDVRELPEMFLGHAAARDSSSLGAAVRLCSNASRCHHRSGENRSSYDHTNDRRSAANNVLLPPRTRTRQ